MFLACKVTQSVQGHHKAHVFAPRAFERIGIFWKKLENRGSYEGAHLTRLRAFDTLPL